LDDRGEKKRVPRVTLKKGGGRCFRPTEKWMSSQTLEKKGCVRFTASKEKKGQSAGPESQKVADEGVDPRAFGFIGQGVDIV